MTSRSAKDEQDRRKAERLAAALRANLRRRKPQPEAVPVREDDR
jgi:hypothetical protein